MKIKPYTSRTRTEEYIKTLKKWIQSCLNEENDAAISFPENNIKDFVLIMNPKLLYIPFADESSKNKVFRACPQTLCYKKEDVRFLKNTPTQVIGVDFGISYDKPEEGELELRCIDGKIRGIDKIQGAGRDFVFIPHPSLLDSFVPYIPFLPGIFGIEPWIFSHSSYRTVTEIKTARELQKYLKNWRNKFD